MKLTEMVEAMNAMLKYERHPEKIDVVITTKLPYATCGQLPCVDVKSVHMGFDWEAGQFRITPAEELMSVKHDAPQKVIQFQEAYHCPKCEHRLSGKQKKPEIRFCSYCGQGVEWEC